MLAMKLQRIGKKHQPSYRLIVTEKRSKLLGPAAEDLGWFNPLLNKREFKRERIEYWLKIGAKPTDTVWNLLVSDGIVPGNKRAVHKQAKKKSGEAESPKPAEAVTAAA